MRAWYSAKQASVAGTVFYEKSDGTEVEASVINTDGIEGPNKPAYDDVQDLGPVVKWKRRGKFPSDGESLQKLIDAGTPLTAEQQALADRITKQLGKLTRDDLDPNKIRREKLQEIRTGIDILLKMNDIIKIKATLTQLAGKLDEVLK